MKSGRSHVTDQGTVPLLASLGRHQQNCPQLSPECIRPFPFLRSPCSATLTCSVSGIRVPQLSWGRPGKDQVQAPGSGLTSPLAYLFF